MLTIEADLSTPEPHDLIVTLGCDGDHSLLKCITVAVLRGPSFGVLRTRAIHSGWLFRDGGVKLGPCCSGKKPA